MKAFTVSAVGALLVASTQAAALHASTPQDIQAPAQLDARDLGVTVEFSTRSGQPFQQTFTIDMLEPIVNNLVVASIKLLTPGTCRFYGSEQSLTFVPAAGFNVYVLPPQPQVSGTCDLEY